ncbi:MAG TPA: sigma-70 family RNA polymerase sigma factor [Candidatus Bathyarchaeia archaeon]|nr:sigma-70 family RNA polymerase sigma factor [Candidatus Bathyarchaeia archaeon]
MLGYWRDRRHRLRERNAAADRLDIERIIRRTDIGDPLNRSSPTEPETWFARLADVELDRAYRLAGLILGSFNDAEDATHDAFVRAWDQVGSLKDPAGFQAWFDRILVNVCRDRLRRSRIVRFVPVDAEAADQPAADAYDRLISERDLLAAIDRLDIDLRIAVVLRFWADLTVDDIADRLGIPAGTVKSRLHRAIGQMRSRLVEGAGTEATS